MNYVVGTRSQLIYTRAYLLLYLVARGYTAVIRLAFGAVRPV